GAVAAPAARAAAAARTPTTTAARARAGTGAAALGTLFQVAHVFDEVGAVVHDVVVAAAATPAAVAASVAAALVADVVVRALRLRALIAGRAIGPPLRAPRLDRGREHLRRQLLDVDALLPRHVQQVAVQP